MHLVRISNKPIFKPYPNNRWERAAVYNAGAVYEDGRLHMIYRATDIGGHEKYGDYINSLGYAVSKDFYNWQRNDSPIMTSGDPQELRGPEDPRIVKIDGIYYMVYVGFSNRYNGDYKICLATSTDLINWDKKGVLLDEENKDSSLFPEKIDNEFLLLHRRKPDIWIANSEDLKTFYNHTKIMSPIPDTWEHLKIGIAGPPVHHPDGWLLFYHAVDKFREYRLGVALLDYKNPRRVLARQSEPVIEPELEWEVNGWVPNVIFSCATVEAEDRYIVLYGGADSVIGYAYIKYEDAKFDDKDWII